MGVFGLSQDAASQDCIDHVSCFIGHLSEDRDRLANDTELAAEVLLELLLGPLGRIVFLRGGSINRHVIQSASLRVSVGVRLVVDEFGERVELWARILAICPGRVAILPDSELEDLAVGCHRRHFSLDSWCVAWHLTDIDLHVDHAIRNVADRVGRSLQWRRVIGDLGWAVLLRGGIPAFGLLGSFVLAVPRVVLWLMWILLLGVLLLPGVVVHGRLPAPLSGRDSAGEHCKGKRFHLF